MSKSNLTRRDIALLAAGGAALAATPASAGGQPNMEKALEFLEAALARLEKANKNKGGHRIKAIEYTKAAIIETKNGIAHAD